ncbi:DUF4142 domain-containing protein [Falsiroseomonas sp. CW058]|uniref:DUF4142 domain-containing protein n=1 Tax=Falsiroseomonas sp. CW058 TaxID=3388664 RepID=UPI003D310168
MSMATRLVAALAAAMATAPAQAQTAPGAPPVATGRTEESAAMTGTAGRRGSEMATRQEFLRLAASSAMYEVETARLALERSQDARLRQYAQEMLDAHQPAIEELRRMVRDEGSLRGMQLSEELGEQHRTWLDQLRQAQGDSFRGLYVRQQVQAHLIAVDMFRNYSQAGDDEALKRWAADRLPRLQDHLRKAQALDA